MRQFILVAALASSVFSLSFLERAQGYLSGGASANASVTSNGAVSSNNWLAGIQNSSFGQAVAGGIDFYNNAKNGSATNNWQQQLGNSSFGTWVQNGVDFYNNAKNGSGNVFNATAIQQQIGNISFGEAFQAGVEFFNNMKNGNGGYSGQQSDVLSMFIPFLANASVEAQTEFGAIAAKLPTMTIAEYEVAVDAWAAKYGLTNEVDAFNQRALNASASAEKKADTVVMNLPNVLNNIKAIGNDKNQTIAQMHSRISEYLASLDDETQEIVIVLFESLLPPGLKSKGCKNGGDFMSNMLTQAVDFFSGNKNGSSDRSGAFSFWGGATGNVNGNGQVHPKIGMISNFLNRNNISENDANAAMDDTASIQILPANVKLGGDFNTQVVDVQEEVPKKNKKQQQQKQQKKKNQNKKKTTTAPVADAEVATEVHTQVL